MKVAQRGPRFAADARSIPAIRMECIGVEWGGMGFLRAGSPRNFCKLEACTTLGGDQPNWLRNSSSSLRREATSVRRSAMVCSMSLRQSAAGTAGVWSEG